MPRIPTHQSNVSQTQQSASPKINPAQAGRNWGEVSTVSNQVTDMTAHYIQKFKQLKDNRELKEAELKTYEFSTKLDTEMINDPDINEQSVQQKYLTKLSKEKLKVLNGISDPRLREEAKFSYDKMAIRVNAQAQNLGRKREITKTKELHDQSMTLIREGYVATGDQSKLDEAANEYITTQLALNDMEITPEKKDAWATALKREYKTKWDSIREIRERDATAKATREAKVSYTNLVADMYKAESEETALNIIDTIVADMSSDNPQYDIQDLKNMQGLAKSQFETIKDNQMNSETFKDLSSRMDMITSSIVSGDTIDFDVITEFQRDLIKATANRDIPKGASEQWNEEVSALFQGELEGIIKKGGIGKKIKGFWANMLNLPGRTVALPDQYKNNAMMYLETQLMGKIEDKDYTNEEITELATGIYNDFLTNEYPSLVGKKPVNGVANKATGTTMLSNQPSEAKADVKIKPEEEVIKVRRKSDGLIATVPAKYRAKITEKYEIIE